jgi:Fe-S-cluster containining protein
MTRTGQCKQCGACCRLLGFWIPAPTTAELKFYEARGVKIMGDMATIEHPCPHLVITFDGRGGRGKPACDFHGDAKPEVCKAFPVEAEHLLPGCGFGFEEEA